MRIALVCYDLSRDGGSERVALNLYQELKKYMEVSLVSLFCSNPDSHLLKRAGGNCHRLKNGNGSFAKDFLKTFRALSLLIKEEKTEIVLSVGINASFYVCLLKKTADVRAVICEHSNLSNILYNTRRQMKKRKIALKWCDRFVTLTEADQREYIRQYPKYKAKISYIYNWIDLDDYRRRRPYNKNSHRILTICRLDRVKGIERSIEAAKYLRAKYPDWTWEVYGMGDENYRKDLEKKIQDNVLPNFYLKGYCSDVVSLLEDAALYICTSYFEGLQISLLEAKALHIPIISFDCKKGPSEIIEDGVNGELIPNGDIPSLVASLDKMMQSQEQREAYSLHAHSNIDKFSKESILKKWMELLDQVKRMSIKE